MTKSLLLLRGAQIKAMQLERSKTLERRTSLSVLDSSVNEKGKSEAGVGGIATLSSTSK